MHSGVSGGLRHLVVVPAEGKRKVIRIQPTKTRFVDIHHLGLGPEVVHPVSGSHHVDEWRDDDVAEDLPSMDQDRR